MIFLCVSTINNTVNIFVYTSKSLSTFLIIPTGRNSEVKILGKSLDNVGFLITSVKLTYRKLYQWHSGVWLSQGEVPHHCLSISEVYHYRLFAELEKIGAPQCHFRFILVISVFHVISSNLHFLFSELPPVCSLTIGSCSLVK